jgi:triosephosphate isomerase (TIM)
MRRERERKREGALPPLDRIAREYDRGVLIAGNWKMHKGPAETAEFCLRLREHELNAVDVVVCPPCVSLAVAVQLLAGTEIAVAAQNVHWENDGAYTGEVSASMLRELGVYGAIVGHSERRQHFGETDESAGRRAKAALDAGLFVIACVGETEEEREQGQTEDVLRRQLSVLEADDNLVVAYEPVWAIGTGKTATPDLAQEAHSFVKSLLDVPVLYGGSVKPDNAAELLGRPGVDGALVGGASLDLDSFTTICRLAIPS